MAASRVDPFQSGSGVLPLIGDATASVQRTLPLSSSAPKAVEPPFHHPRLRHHVSFRVGKDFQKRVILSRVFEAKDLALRAKLIQRSRTQSKPTNSKHLWNQRPKTLVRFFASQTPLRMTAFWSRSQVSNAKPAKMWVMEREHRRTPKRMLGTLFGQRLNDPVLLKIVGAFLWMACGLLPTLAADTARKPNIVFILADDLGWKDLSCYGSYSYNTPNIDRLCRSGIRFTQAYAYPSCSPTRSSLMTGMDPARLGITAPVCHQDQVVLEPTVPANGPKWQKVVTPTPVTRLDTRFVSYARILKEAGYVTGHFGKWHLGREPYSPLQHGFDVDVPHWDGPGPGASYVAPWNPKLAAGFRTPAQPNEHLEDRMAREASAFIEKNRDKPFLLNYWAFSVHSPLNAKDDYIKKHANLYGSFTPQRNPVYAAMIESLDDAVGTLLDTLKRTGIADRTIVIFLSDNGGLGYWEGGMQHREYEGTPATSNAPLRSGKGWVYEGGVRVPLIVSWPSVVKPDSVSNALVSSMDLYPTILEIGSTAPRKGQPLDGVSLVPVLNGTRRAARNTVYCVSPQYCLNYLPLLQPPAASIHSGNWKLIRFFADTPNASDRMELYNLKDDIGESFDMSDAMPGLAQSLSKRLDAYIASIHAALPKPNPKYDQNALPPPQKRRPSEPVTLPDEHD